MLCTPQHRAASPLVALRAFINALAALLCALGGVSGARRALRRSGSFALLVSSARRLRASRDSVAPVWRMRGCGSASGAAQRGAGAVGLPASPRGHFRASMDSYTASGCRQGGALTLLARMRPHRRSASGRR